MAAQDPVLAAGDIYRRYFEEYRRFVSLMTRCWLKGWPDKRRAIESTERVAHIWFEQGVLRLDYLLRENLLKPSIYRSVGDIHDRIFDKWSEAEEEALIASNPAYKDLIAARHAAWSPDNADDTKEPAEMAMRDPEFLKAASGFMTHVKNLNLELQKLFATDQITPK